jgi:hypothetical protein
VSDIYVDRDGMTRVLGTVTDQTDRVDDGVAAAPSSVDGGIASSLIGFLSSAGAEAALLASSSYRGVCIVASDVLGDLTATDEHMAEEIEDLHDEIVER